MSARIRRASALLLCCALLAGLLPVLSPPAEAADRILLQAQAQTLAVANSVAITKKTNEIILKEIKYVESVDVIKAKVKNLRSFRWSPLLSFKLPQKLDLVEEYELNIKPLTLQAELDTLRHELGDLRYQALAEVNKAYTDVYILQEKVTFTQARLDSAQAELTRNQARLAAGNAVQSDIDNMEKKVKKLTTELSNQKRKFQTAKEELSDLIGLDVTSGFLFRNPLKELTLPRQQLEQVVEYTLEHDQTFYAAKMAASTAFMNLSSYESLMKSQYGSNMNYIQTFIDMAKQGQDVDYSAFMIKYKEMLVALDKPWSFKIRILFFRFTMEWFKGAIDGTRYIEDEIYAVYTACMEYANAKRERDAAEKTLRKQVETQYELLITAWGSYQSMADAVETDRVLLDKVSALNKLGKASYDELKAAQDAYEEDQLEAVDALASYNTLLYDFDRLTCGAVTLYLKGADLNPEAGAGGDSFAKLDPIDEPYYYIYTTVEDLTFHVGVSIPDDFEPAVTHFEVWHGDVQIGERLAINKELRHLTLDYGGDSRLTLRFYNDANFVAECVIDATVPRDRLVFASGEEKQSSVETGLGTYEVSTTAVGQLSTSTLTLKINPDVDAESFTITYGTGNVYTSEPQSVDEPFTYLTLLIASLEDVELVLYDRDGEVVLTAFFETKSQTIRSLLIA